MRIAKAKSSNLDFCNSLDILNIVSPGGLPNGITEQELMDGRSEVRNRVIARVFKELGFIEQWGSGIKRIKSSCINHGLKEPVIKESGDFINVELFRLNEELQNVSA